jgi:hypothetical protein
MLVVYCKTRLTLARVKELRELDDSGGLGRGFPVAGRLTIETLEAVHTNWSRSCSAITGVAC